MTSAYIVARGIVEHLASVHGGYDDAYVNEDSNALAEVVNIDFAHALALAVSLDYACLHDIPDLISHARKAIHYTADLVA